MAEPLSASRTPSISGWPVLPLFLAVNALFRGAFLGINQGEYTDGILQVTQFEHANSFWPPLYTALVWALRHGLGLDAIWAGRFVSWGAAVALVVPLWRVAERWGGRRVAFWTLAIYTVSPVALRWSVRLMTDMLFACLLFWAAEVWLGLQAGARRAGGAGASDAAPPDEGGAAGHGTHRAGAGAVLLTVLAVLATLTRYQGLLLGPLVWLVLVQAVRGRWGAAASAGERRWRAAAWGAQALWLALPAWLLWQRFQHFGQVGNRWHGLLPYWDFCEMFLYVTPYVLTLPVFAFFVYGLASGRRGGLDAGRALGRIEGASACVGTTNVGEPFPAEASTTNVCRTGFSRRALSSPPYPLLPLFAYMALAILPAQSVFQSFQERYIFPLLLFAFVLAGAGMARAEERLAGCCRAGRVLFATLATVALVWSLGFGLASIFLQREAFGDLFRAAARIRTDASLPADAVVYTTETYTNANGAKMAFLTGRRTETVPEYGYWYEYYVRCQQQPYAPRIDDAAKIFPASCPRMAAGSVLVLHSMNDFGMAAHRAFAGLLQQRYRLRPLVGGGTFTATLVPLLPDLMGELGSHQQPLAWAKRYEPQYFRTDVFVVEGPAGP